MEGGAGDRMKRYDRDYGACEEALSAAALKGQPTEAKMAAVVDALWASLKDCGVAWLGFYAIAGDRETMILRSCTPKPACSPIGLNGVCGRGWLERRTQIVPDVHALGEAHIVCDPLNLSEIVVPLINEDGSCDAVLDVDSRELDAFGEADDEGLARVLRAAHLTI